MKSPRPSLESLRMFEACARHSSYARAAEELNISAAAVSQRMRDLQSELEVRLFDRHGPRITPTEEGRSLAAELRQGFAIIRAAVQSCRAPSTVRVTAAPTFASRWLAPRLAAFREACGPLRVAVDAAVDLRPAGSFDLAVRSGLGSWTGYSAVRLFPVDMSPLYNPQRYSGLRPSAVSDLAECNLIHSEHWETWFAQAGVPLPINGLRYSEVRYPTQELAGAAAIEGAGFALLSPRLFAEELKEGRLAQPFSFTLEAQEAYWVIVEEHEARAPVLALRDWLVDASRQP